MIWTQCISRGVIIWHDLLSQKLDLYSGIYGIIQNICRLFFFIVFECKDPGMPLNGIRTGDSLQVGSSLSFSCREGFNIEGATSITCNVDGKWSSEIPKCRGTCDVISVGKVMIIEIWCIRHKITLPYMVSLTGSRVAHFTLLSTERHAALSVQYAVICSLNLLVSMCNGNQDEFYFGGTLASISYSKCLLKQHRDFSRRCIVSLLYQLFPCLQMSQRKTSSHCRCASAEFCSVYLRTHGISYHLFVLKIKA